MTEEKMITVSEKDWKELWEEKDKYYALCRLLEWGSRDVDLLVALGAGHESLAHLFGAEIDKRDVENKGEINAWIDEVMRAIFYAVAETIREEYNLPDVADYMIEEQNIFVNAMDSWFQIDALDEHRWGVEDDMTKEDITEAVIKELQERMKEKED